MGLICNYKNAKGESKWQLWSFQMLIHIWYKQCKLQNFYISTHFGCPAENYNLPLCNQISSLLQFCLLAVDNWVPPSISNLCIHFPWVIRMRFYQILDWNRKKVKIQAEVTSLLSLWEDQLFSAVVQACFFWAFHHPTHWNAYQRNKVNSMRKI